MKHILGIFALLTLLLTIYLPASHQHGALVEPPSRNAAWKTEDEFKKCCTNYDYNELNCGGTTRQWQWNGGKCGVCGDPWDGPRLYEKGGDKYLGKIMRTFTKGSPVDVEILMTANHKGIFEFRICNLDKLSGDVTQECLNKTVLKIRDTDETQFIIDNKMKQVYTIQLPDDLVCEHCVLQWKWIAAKDWGTDETGRSCMGCGLIQENTYNCADISIKNGDSGEFKRPLTTTKYNEQPTTEQMAAVRSTKMSIESEKSDHRYSVVHGTCATKLKFGITMNFANLLDIFCENFCASKCTVILEQLNQNLKNHIRTEPSQDLISCLDTCPIVCNC